MVNDIDSKPRALVVGLGVTGLSCVRYLQRQGYSVTVVDSRQQPPMAEEAARLADVAMMTGGFASAPWEESDLIVVSPGVSLAEPMLKQAQVHGIEIVGDIELFARAAPAPVVAVTGSNGKSTVTSLAGAMCEAHGMRTVVAGNIGVPVLDLLDQKARVPDIFVLELSSFQLETTSSLALRAAAIINISEDHMDRYPDLASYRAAKARILAHARTAVINRDDPLTRNLPVRNASVVTFGADAPPTALDYGLAMHNGAEWLMRGDTPLMRSADVPLSGRHNLLNVMAAMAIAGAAGVSDAAMVAATRGFRGLPHRMEPVGEIRGVRFINDSKGTNVGATIAALSGMDAPVVLIAGGDGKGADFTPLRDVLASRGRALVLIGRDAPVIARAVGAVVPVHHAASMKDAVRTAAGIAQPGDVVLLSPACASFDMFANYAERGDTFRREVGALA